MANKTAAVLGGVAAVIAAITSLVVGLKSSPEPKNLTPPATNDSAPESQYPSSTAPPASVGVSGTNQSITGNNNTQISGSNNVINPLPVPKPCRDKSHGVESYARTFDVPKTSQWMGGGYSQDPWCNDVIGELRGQFPEALFEVIGKSENTKNTCAPFNCPQYQYYCNVRVKTDPIYIEKLSSACR